MTTPSPGRERGQMPPSVGDPLLAKRAAQTAHSRTADPTVARANATPTSATPTRSTPARATPPRSTPPRVDPARASPVRSSPVRSSPARATPASVKRRHPAKGSRAAALAISIGSTAGLAVSFAHADTPVGLGTGAGAGSGTAAGPLQPPVVVAARTPATSLPLATAPVARANALADGTFAGQTFTNRWGPVQVQVTIHNGQITDVAAVQMPGGQSRSIQITRIVTPILRSEVLAAQSTHIDTVSGATYTSTDYRRSLQSALDVAKASAA